MKTLENIWQGVLAGDREAQKQLYLQSSKELMNICRRYLSDDSSQFDAMQESYIKIFTKAHTYQQTNSNLLAWIARITVNECLQILRKQKKLVLLDVSSTHLEPKDPEDIIAQLSAEEIYHEVEKLPAGYKAVFNMYVVEGFNHNEIGEMLNISASTSRSQLTRAKIILQKAIKKKTNLRCYEKAR